MDDGSKRFEGVLLHLDIVVLLQGVEALREKFELHDSGFALHSGASELDGSGSGCDREVVA